MIVAMHRVQQRQLPLAFVRAGLPILPRLTGESKSYEERLPSFLAMEGSAKALHGPASEAGVVFEPKALEAS